jgi:hypothetical protein
MDGEIPWESDPIQAVLPGPFASVVDASAAILHPDVDYLEVNGDGVMDQVRVLDEEERIEFVWGPPSRWTPDAAPDLVIAPACDDPSYGDGANGWILGQVPRVFPDVTGDGAPELLVDGYMMDVDHVDPACSNYLLSLPPDGVHDLVGIPAGFTYSRESMHVVPDQSGDGLADVFMMGSVYAAPVTFGPGGETTSTTVYTMDPAVSVSLYPQPFDADGDGLSDFLGYDYVMSTSGSGFGPRDSETNKAMFFVSGGANLATTQITEGWDLAGGSFGTGWVEDGVAVVLVRTDLGVYPIEVGPATAMSP